MNSLYKSAAKGLDTQKQQEQQICSNFQMESYELQLEILSAPTSCPSRPLTPRSTICAPNQAASCYILGPNSLDATSLCPPTVGPRTRDSPAERDSADSSLSASICLLTLNMLRIQFHKTIFPKHTLNIS